MNSALDSLSKVFTQRIFRIPDYQRGYAWTEQQVQEFWTDLVSLDEGKDHYFGVLTLESVPQAKVSQWKDDTWLIRERGFSPYYVVDGQQRLTTALILIQTIIENIPTDLDFNYQQPTDITHKYIVEKRKNGLQSFIFGYEEDNPSYEFLKTQIFGSSPETHTSDDQTIYTKNLQAAKSYFLERIQSMPLEQREVLFKKVTQHFLFNLFSMSGEIDVCVAFEAMNNRGKRLTYLELLKNRLIYLTTRIEADATERKQLRDQINEAWKAIYYQIGRNQDTPLNDDELLFHHYQLWDFSDKPDTIRNHRQNDYESVGSTLLDKIFTSQNIGTTLQPYQEPPNGAEHGTSEMADETSTTKKEPSIQINPKLILSYVIDLRRCAQYYFETFNPTYARRLSSETQKQITRLDRLLFTGRRDTHPIASTILAVISVSSRSEANKSVEKILANIERIGFLILLVRYRSSHFQEIEPPLRVFRRCAKLLWHNEQSIEEVLTIFENYNSALTNVINIPDAIKTWGDKAYYGWESLAYFLFEYEVSLMEQSKTARHKLSWADFANEHYLADYSTIEHIYPQNPRSPAWHTLYSHFSKEERRALRNSLGNLLALSKPKNSTLSNRPFIEKCAGSTKMNGYRTGSYSEIEISTLSQWGAKEIVERGVRLLSFLEKRWDIPLGDDAKKIELLGLSSVLSKI